MLPLYFRTHKLDFVIYFTTDPYECGFSFLNRMAFCFRLHEDVLDDLMMKKCSADSNHQFDDYGLKK